MNLKEVLDHYRVPVAPPSHHHATPGKHQLDCPWCSPGSGRFRLGFGFNGRFCSCWTCGPKKPIDTLALLTGESWGKCRELLGGIEPEQWEEPTQRGKLVVPDGVADMLPVHRQYLANRGIDPDNAEAVWGVRGIGNAGKLAWRLWIPITLHGETVSWTTRAIGEGLRYVNARPEQEVLPAKSLLFGEDLTGHAILVCEGQMDAIKIGPGAVATAGLTVTQQQTVRIAKYARRVVVFDSEPSAQRRADKLCNDLSCFPGETLRAEMGCKDPGDATPEQIRELRGLIE